MYKVRVILKSGNEFTMLCSCMTVTTSNITGGVTNIKYDGCVKNRPLYIDLSQISAVLQEEVADDADKSC